MSFLAPLLLVGLGTIAVPIFVHLIQRERTRVVHFPSLMFVQKIPYQSVQRRKLRHWFLLLMRIAALALIVAAFARPFFREGAAAALAATGGSRELVIVLDQSASMGYGDRWSRAVDAARNAIASMGPGDRATLVTFGRSAEERIRATTDRGRLEATLATAQLSASGTRMGPALKLAESVVTRSTLPRKEVVLISDFQRSAWSGSEDVHFGEGLTLTPVPITDAAPANLSVPSVSFARAPFQNQERVTVTAGVSNRSATDAKGVAVSLEIDGHVIENKSVDVAANASASVAFTAFTLPGPGTRGIVTAGSDPLAADNTFDFVLNPNQSMSVLVIDSVADTAASFYLNKALAIGNTPTFQVETLPAARVTPQSLERRSVVILNNAPLPPGLGVSGLKAFVEKGGGVLLVLGDRSTWPANDTDLLPGRLGLVIDRTDGRGATLGFRDYSHPVFELFKAPRSGDFSAARILRYRAIDVPATDRVLARYDDGAVAAAERRVGTGRFIAFTTSLDDAWTDLALKPVYLPLMHQLVRYLGQYEQASAWSTVGQVVDLSTLLKSRADRVVVTPKGDRTRFPAGEPAVLELSEHGVYEIRTSTDASVRPERIAVNIEASESDLTPMDPAELVASVTGRAALPTTSAAGAPPPLTPDEAEKHQSLWWYLLVGGVVLLAAENVVANRLSRNERFT